MPRTNPTHGRVGRPPVTSRTQILTVARRLIDESGWDKLTIRGLAAEIGIGATTLYHHVRDKEDLLLLLIHEYAQQIPHPEQAGEPRDRIVAAATAIHDALTEWPLSAEVLTSDRFISRLSTPALRLIEDILSGSIDHGCTPEQAVQVFRNIWYFTVGEVLIRDHSADARTRDEQTRDEPSAGPGAFVNELDEDQLPHLTALNDRWTALAALDTFPSTLDVLVDGLLSRATSSSTRSPNR